MVIKPVDSHRQTALVEVLREIAGENMPYAPQGALVQTPFPGKIHTGSWLRQICHWV